MTPATTSPSKPRVPVWVWIIVALFALGVLFVGGIVALGAGFFLLGREPPADIARPAWVTGQTVDVEVTLVRSDRQDLVCAASETIAGRRCAYQAEGKLWASAPDPANVLRPYTTTEHVQFFAAGLWTDPAFAPDKLPAIRFAARCRYTVEGTLRDASVRWETAGQWYPHNAWPAGAFSGCKVAP
jgi:hypothetical protein